MAHFGQPAYSSRPAILAGESPRWTTYWRTQAVYADDTDFVQGLLRLKRLTYYELTVTR